MCVCSKTYTHSGLSHDRRVVIEKMESSYSSVRIVHTGALNLRKGFEISMVCGEEEPAQGRVELGVLQ